MNDWLPEKTCREFFDRSLFSTQVPGTRNLKDFHRNSTPYFHANLLHRVVTWSGPEKSRQMTDIEVDGDDDVEQVVKKFDDKFSEVTLSWLGLT